MIDISPDAPEKSILDFVKRWMKLLADDPLDESCALLEHPNRFGVVWTPDLIKETVHDTFSPDTLFYKYHPEGPIFTDPYELEEQRDIEPIEFDDGSGYAFDYAVPLNGEWSDLTAQFEILKRPNGYAVFLDDLHVL
jgi:hypothetical protein